MSEIKLKNLKKSFGKTDVIHDLSIDVKNGELIVIVIVCSAPSAQNDLSKGYWHLRRSRFNRRSLARRGTKRLSLQRRVQGGGGENSFSCRDLEP